MENRITSSKISTNLWFDHIAEPAVDFYLSVFKNASKGRVARYGNAGQEFHGMEPGTILTIEFKLEGQTFVALNAGPEFKFNESISFIINCNDQEEVDYYWDKLSDGGEIQMCGWLKDQFGVSWQVVPTVLTDLLQNSDPKKTSRVMAALMTMKKLDIAKLKQASEG
ncbi:VOC family protein [Pedobacter metabolipauper]|uniref:Putative 3-demethylubiquinone-9 3-methyltransferase (Glyoxalase superfamily) n=1 Tax=Pedobacter metabolipauper TaxID=425513 RepID=A0A4R6SSN7_9SPHI|nr:VOC family protein [Pedobacter metabolipauper]TDQ08405.1 putative 3-demethylubiquinone-9 3-methyltransferase (glyoxalase superfamily) [Pedobacter metabolipauper]